MAEPVALGIQQPNLMGSLGQLLGLKQQQQALQGQAADVQNKQLDARQRQFLSSYDYTQHLAPDGTPDLNSLVNDKALQAGAGDKFYDVISHAAVVKQQQLDSMKSLVGLRNDQREAFGQIMGGLRQTPGGPTTEDLQGAFEKYHDMYGDSVLPVLNAYAPQLKKVPPDKLDGALQSVQMQSVAAGSQLDKQQPNLVNTGGNIQNTNPLTPPSQQVKPIPVTLAPGANLVQDAYGRTSVFNPQRNTVAPIGAGGSGGAGGNPAFTQPVADQKNVMGQISAARDIGGANANTSRNINNELLRLSKDTKTGPGTSTWQNFIGGAGAMIGLSPNANHQEIGAYLDRQAAMAANAMGVPNTNAGLAAAQSASGTTEYSPKALQEKVKFADAMNSGAIAYRKGLNKAVGTGATPDLSKYQAFKESWADNFDTDIFRVEDAQRHGDTDELNSLKKKVGKQGMADLRTKSENLRKLESGEIP